jgi:hypothetical protein
MKRLLLCLSVPTAFVVGSCHKKEEMPTPSGTNTLFCRIEGREFTPYLEPILLTPRQALRAYRTAQGSFFVQAQDAANVLQLYATNVRGPGTYTLSFARNPVPYDPNPDGYGFYQKSNPVPPGGDPFNPPAPSRFYTDATNTGTVRVTRFDTLGRVAGGTFEYTVREAATGKLVRITNGKFDVKF